MRVFSLLIYLLNQQKIFNSFKWFQSVSPNYVTLHTIFTLRTFLLSTKWLCFACISAHHITSSFSFENKIYKTKILKCTHSSTSIKQNLYFCLKNLKVFINFKLFILYQNTEITNSGRQERWDIAETVIVTHSGWHSR